MDYRTFGLTTIRKADVIWAIFPLLDRGYLDSTLLIAWVCDSKLTMFMFGDGVFFHRSGESVRAVHVEYAIPKDGVDKPAPDYLSYLLDERRKEDYTDLGGVKRVYDCIIQGKNVSGTETPVRPFDPVVITAPVSKGDVIAVCSDGINSFRQGNTVPITWQEMVPEFVGFKNFKGVFVRRRLRRLSQDCRAKDWSHSDDISMAAIVV